MPFPKNWNSDQIISKNDKRKLFGANQIFSKKRMKEFQLHQIVKEMKIEFQRKRRNFDGFENILCDAVFENDFQRNRK